MEKQIKKIILMAIGFAMLTTTALAHKVIVFAWVEQGRIHIEGSFGSDRPAKNCKIQVKNPNGILLHLGITDAKGIYSLKIPDDLDSDLIVEMNAGPGHLGHWTIPENELVHEPTTKILERKMNEKQSLEKAPSLVKIGAGIALIFGLSFGMAFFKKRKKYA